ncbi:hypothetical protein KI659_06795 [Litoribacter alkaliphilus]|uniref:Uncharacterized protein n=1 Tax=Litoribacter ruber TaxID=702568 RepID=A0AAP2CJI8_9BACT|nr:hypothetical protein [Litoribacter alkaliphilus]MBS9523725.1 hypothetical protein [Litoribacter alkaliphilus]
MKKALILIPAVLFVGLVGYFLLGGFNELELEVVQTDNIHLMGYQYRGTPQDEALPQTFQKAEGLLGDGKTLHTLYQVEPAGKLDTMEVFIGVEFSGEMGDAQELLIESQNAIVATMRSSRYVMPGPNKVKKRIEKFAELNGLETQGIYIDRIVESDHVEVWAPLK